MDGKMKVAVMKDIRKIEMEERKIPSIKRMIHSLQRRFRTWGKVLLK